ncbi:MAG: hypothetical protein APF82_08795 [Sphingomonadales bacterium BRH_c42]|nr:MAG: hypothetical protein APF82_08795 [Sphingomonadales bacterium BRH_c42]
MLFELSSALALLFQPAAQGVDVAYQSMAQGQDQQAIELIEANDALETDDPARLINLGIAHARKGDDVRARLYFQAAIDSRERYDLETASGNWVDSRTLARRAMKMLDRGEFGGQRMTLR